MPIYRVEVDLALRRPPTADVTVSTTVDADNSTEARLTAIAMASCFHPSTVMAVGDRWQLLTRDYPDDWWESETLAA